MTDQKEQNDWIFPEEEGFFRRNRRTIIGIISVLVLMGLGGYFYLAEGRKSKAEEAVAEEQAAEVVTKSFGELVSEVKIEKIATIEPVVGAPLVARAGGRVTAIEVDLGEEVAAGRIVASIDAGIEANPARAQLAAVQSSLGQINSIEKEAMKAGENGVKMAQLAVDAAKAGKSLSTRQLAKSREQAELAVRQADLAYNDAVDAEQRVDQVVRAADIGLSAAKLARDQAAIAQQATGRQTSDAQKQTEQSLAAAKQTMDKIRADIQAQRVSLQGQAMAAAEQVKMAQVISPVAGQVTRLTVKRGDFVRPGQEVGEVMAFEGARIRLDVATGVRASLHIGDSVEMSARGQNLEGIITRLADGPRTDMALWQVDIFVSGTPEVIHPGDLVVVKLPVTTGSYDSRFIPLDAVVVRQEGVVLLTADSNGLVGEHLVTPISYTGDFIEGKVDINDSDAVIIQGQRRLRAGDIVKIKS